MKAVLVCILCCLLPLSAAQAAGPDVQEAPVRIAATTFPIFQILRQITRQVPDVTIDCILPASAGCPHEYALTPQDRRRLQSCDILVINGLGLEDALTAALRTDSTAQLVDSAAGLSGLLPSREEHDHPHGEEQHHAVNPHLFASPRRVAELTRNISAQLERLDPAHAALYRENARGYAQRMDALAQEFAALGARLAPARIIAQDEMFEYLAADMGLSLVAVLLQTENQQPSASQILQLLTSLRDSGASAIVTQPQYPARLSEMLSRESGLPVILLDPVATGPGNAPLEYYEHIMRQNLRTLEQSLGKH